MMKGKDFILSALSKKSENLSTEEIELLDRFSFRKTSLIYIFSLIGIWLVLSIITMAVNIKIAVAPVITSGVFCLAGAIHLTVRNIRYYSLKSFGLSKQEYKELKKSGAVKKANELCKEVCKLKKLEESNNLK